MKQMPTLEESVSCVIPVRNRPELLISALESVIHSTVLPGQIHVVTNGAPEERKADRMAFDQWLESYGFSLPAMQSPMVHFHECLRRSGPAAARNLGVQKSDAEWIAFLDSDDTWMPEKLQRQIAYLEKRPHLEACHSHEQWIKNGKEIPTPLRLQPATGRPLIESLHTCLISASSLIIRKDAFLAMGGFDERFPSCEDYEFWIRFFLTRSMGCLPEPLVQKRSGDWKQVSTSGMLDLHRLRALLLNATHLCDIGLQLALLDSARQKASILMQKNDEVSKRALRLFRALEHRANTRGRI